MKKYDYYKNVKKDIKKNLATMFNSQATENFDVHDAVTGYKSGGLISCPKKASGYVRQNMDLLKKACYECGYDLSEHIGDPCKCDVIIRCYVFQQMFDSIVQEYDEKPFSNNEGN